MKISELNPALQELHTLFGDAGVRDLLIAYRDTVQEFDQFLKGRTTKDAEVQAMLHKVRSASWSMGETELANFCDQIEQSTDAKELLARCKLHTVRVLARVEYQIRGLNV